MEFRLIYTSSNKKLTEAFPCNTDIATTATKDNCRFFYITNTTFANKIRKNKVNLDVSEELNIISADLYTDFLSTATYPVPVLKYELTDPTTLKTDDFKNISSFVTAYNTLTKEPETKFTLDATKCEKLRVLYALVLVKTFNDEDIRKNETKDCKVYSLYKLTQTTGEVVVSFSNCPNRGTINREYAQVQGHIPFGKDMKETIYTVGNLDAETNTELSQVSQLFISALTDKEFN